MRRRRRCEDGGRRQCLTVETWSVTGCEGVVSEGDGALLKPSVLLRIVARGESVGEVLESGSDGMRVRRRVSGVRRVRLKVGRWGSRVV
jgi:hypothetical protein